MFIHTAVLGMLPVLVTSTSIPRDDTSVSATSAAPDGLYETLKQTALGHFHAHESPDPFDPTEIDKFRSEDAFQRYHPQDSIPEASRAPQYKQAHDETLKLLSGPIQRLTFDLHDMSVDSHNRLVAMRFNATYDFKAFGDEPAEYGYAADYMWVMEMEASGQKITRVDEFLDPQRVVDHIMVKAEKYAAWSANNTNAVN
ncbi:hypothetical protein NLG97_g2983 [Lecanicillium saksenae]|uniref:Uncharacterized protein n=1 Tax=Lecanicillium saksenae TaxID=468837 RepID=A0ACC1R197_9HYPO|nr:hypothetical protein NLG97_g2983 [Lecanicillium saksenae]